MVISVQSYVHCAWTPLTQIAMYWFCVRLQFSPTNNPLCIVCGWLGPPPYSENPVFALLQIGCQLFVAVAIGWHGDVYSRFLKPGRRLPGNRKCLPPMHTHTKGQEYEYIWWEWPLDLAFVEMHHDDVYNRKQDASTKGFNWDMYVQERIEFRTQRLTQFTQNRLANNHQGAN